MFQIKGSFPGLRVLRRRLFDLALEVLAGNQVGDVVVILTTLLVLLGHVLVALGELAQGCEGVGSELVQDAGDELSELLVLAGSVDGEGVGGDSGVNWSLGDGQLPTLCALTIFAIDGKMMTYPWERRSG